MRRLLYIIIIVSAGCSTVSTEKGADGYFMRFQILCDEDNAQTLSLDTLRKYKSRPYNISCHLKDSARISFDFNEDCCMEFSGKAALSHDTLILSYYQSNEENCLCHCNYRLLYTADNSVRQWNHFIILKK